MKIGTNAFGERVVFRISRLIHPVEMIMKSIKGDPVANCTCDDEEFTHLQQEVKVRVYMYMSASEPYTSRSTLCTHVTSHSVIHVKTTAL